jgi:sulfur-carrier protein
MIRVVVPAHLRILAGITRGSNADEIHLEVVSPVTRDAILDALELKYPVLRGTIRDQVTGERRAFLRFFACQEDLTHESRDALLPEAVSEGREPYLIVGAIAGG